jgi:hypothetical protein
MLVEILFNCNNAAFEDNFKGEVNHVMSQAVRKIHEQVARDTATICDAPEAGDTLLDSNGNSIGTVSVTGTVDAGPCKHEPDWSTARPAEGADGTVDVWCPKCGLSGSFAVDPSDVNWG